MGYRKMKGKTVEGKHDRAILYICFQFLNNIYNYYLIITKTKKNASDLFFL